MPAVEQSKTEKITVPAPEFSGVGATSIHSSNMNGNHVMASDGHVTMHHQSGTVVQISSSGSVIIYSATEDIWNYGGNLIEVARSGKDIIVQGGNINIEVKNGHCNLTVQGNMNHVVKGDYTLEVSGKMNIFCGEQFEAQGAKVGLHSYTDSVNISGKRGLYMSSEWDVGLTSLLSINMQSMTGSLNGRFTQDVNLTALKSLKLNATAGTMDLRSGLSTSLHATGGDVNMLGGKDVKISAAGGSTSLIGSQALNLQAVGGTMNILGGAAINMHSNANKIDIQNGTATPGTVPTPALVAIPFLTEMPTKNEAPKIEPRSGLPQQKNKNRTRTEIIALSGKPNESSDPDEGGRIDA
jgi:hypothetical protein